MIASAVSSNTPVTFRFINLHPFLVIEVSRENGSREPWELEMDRRELAGIGITAESFQPGDAVLVRAGRVHAPRGQRD
jgi:hypothetical protein